MAHVKTAVSMPATLFKRMDALARRLKVSRSRLFVLALQEFCRRQENLDLLERINAAYDDDVPDPDEAELLRKMHGAARDLTRLSAPAMCGKPHPRSQ